MGKVWTKLIKPIRNFNVEEKAFKELEKQTIKHKPAPRYPDTKKVLEDYAKEYPEHLEAQKRKDDKLLKNLQGLHVEPLGSVPEIKSRPLPVDRKSAPLSEFGYTEVKPKDVPKGKVTLQQAITFINDHRENEDGYPTSAIAKDYKLEKVDVDNVIKYFQTFRLFIPKEVVEKHGGRRDLKELESKEVLTNPFLLRRLKVEEEQSDKKQLLSKKNSQDEEKKTKDGGVDSGS